MKKIKFCLLAVALMTVCISAHAAGIQEYYAGKDSSSNKDFSDNIGKQWLLTNVSIDGSDTGFSRNELSGFNNWDEIFTLNFAATTIGTSGNISGVGAPNRYSSSYTFGENQTIKLLPMRSTLMASLFEPENLKEHDYFNYLQGAYKWQRKANKLEIYSKAEDKEVVLTFISGE